MRHHLRMSRRPFINIITLLCLDDHSSILLLDISIASKAAARRHVGRRLNNYGVNGSQIKSQAWLAPVEIGVGELQCQTNPQTPPLILSLRKLCDLQTVPNESNISTDS